MSDKIEACACGSKTRLHIWEVGGTFWYRRCNKSDSDCWIGPVCNSPKEADAAWNEVMRAVRIYREMKEKVESRAEAELDLTNLPKGKPTAYSEGGPAR